MGKQHTRTKGHGFDGTPYRLMADQLQQIIEEELTVAGRDGVIEAQDTLDAAGTGRFWSKGPSGMAIRSAWSEGGTGDRSKTDTMRDTLEYRIIRGKGVGLDVGWPRIWKEYFGYQDQGFDSTGLRKSSPGMGDHVAGMGIMAHLHTYMRDSVDKAMDRAIERIIDGL